MAEEIKIELVVRLRGDKSPESISDDLRILLVKTRKLERPLLPRIGERYPLREKLWLKVSDITHPWDKVGYVRVAFNVREMRVMDLLSEDENWIEQQSNV